MGLGRFISSLYKIYKKNIYNIVKELRKTIKKSMATGIAQTSCTALSAYQGEKVSFRLVLKQMRFYGLVSG